MKPYLLALAGVGTTGFALLLIFLTRGSGFPLLVPAGAIGTAERDLMLHALFLMLIVVVPVILLAIFIAWHYREGNTRARYTPNWEQSKMEELIWWSIPFEIILVLSALTWSGTHELDPAKPLASSEPPLTVQVVALPWKWLFIYPELGVASVNEVALPVGRPIVFDITADAPMNSFWIPALGGQMYAMTGMSTKLNLIASHVGDFEGLSANYSGEGFAQMKFTARAMSADDFAAWTRDARSEGHTLDNYEYSSLRIPSDAGPVRYYGIVHMTYADILNSYMPSLHQATHIHSATTSMEGMNMSQ